MSLSKTLSKRSLFTKAISVFIAHTFLLSNVAFAVPQADNPQPAPQAQQDDIISSPEKIVIPRDFGLVKSKHAGPERRLIVHIQDAHCNFEAQSNIVKILENLIRNYSLNFVSVEGAEGFVDTSWFKSFPDEDVRKEVATYFMKKGEITGPEFLSITTDYPFKLFGAETKEYYIENLNAFTSSYPFKEETEKYYTQIKTILNRLKDHVYTDELKEFDLKKDDYETKKMSFNDYIRYLQALSEKHKVNIRQYDNFFKLISTLVYEKKIDFTIVDKERNTLIDELTKKLPKDAVQELVMKSLTFKVGKISAAEYYQYLRQISQSAGIDLPKTHPNVSNYIIYTTVYSRIENEQLFHEMKIVEDAIKDKMFESDEQKALDEMYHHVNTILGLINIKLLNGDFEYYLAHKNEFEPQVFAGFIKKEGEKYGFAYVVDSPSEAVSTSVPKLEDFYKIAIKRDRAIVDNTLDAMKKNGIQLAVLVAGGFHTEGMSKLFEKEGVSYLVVSPNITKDVPTPYIQVLTNQKTPFEELLVGATEAKEGLLAAILRTWITRNDTAKIISGAEIPEQDKNKLLAAIGAKQKEIKEDWIRLHVARWMYNQLKKTGDRGSPPSKENYSEALAAQAKKVGLNPEETANIIGSPDLYEAFGPFALPGSVFDKPPAPVTYRMAASSDTRTMVIYNAKNALLQNNAPGLYKALETTYNFAAVERYPYPLSRIINIFAAQTIPEKINLGKAALLKLAGEYPLWIRKDLTAASSPKGQKFLEDIFAESGVNKEVESKDIVAVIMAGGGGERLFPISTAIKPKQLADLADVELVVMAIRRLTTNLPKENIYIQTIPELKEPIRQLLQRRNAAIPAENIFAEPKAADTAGAIGYAAAKLTKLGKGKSVMFVGTADHYIDVTTPNFTTAYMGAARVAMNTPAIGTLAINPQAPSEEYGHIQKGPETFFFQETRARMVEKFIEKPEARTAIYLFNALVPGSDEHVWGFNSGMFIGRPDVFLNAFNEVAPAYGKAFADIVKAVPDEEERVEREAFNQLAEYKAGKGFPHAGGIRKGTSIDYVLAEPLSRGETAKVALFTIPGEFTWKDIGGYRAIYEYYRGDYLDIKKGARKEGERVIRGDARKDENGNVVVSPKPENITLVQSTNVLVLAKNPNVKMKLTNLRDVVIAFNPETNAVMIAPLDVKGDSIKELLAAVRADPDLAGYATGDASKAWAGDIVIGSVARPEVTLGMGAVLDVEAGLFTMKSQGSTKNLSLEVANASPRAAQAGERVSAAAAETERPANVFRRSLDRIKAISQKESAASGIRTKPAPFTPAEKAFFEIAESASTAGAHKQLVEISNDLLGILKAKPSKELIEGLRAFYANVIEMAQAEGRFTVEEAIRLQTAANQALVIISLVESREAPGAENLLLTANPEDMLIGMKSDQTQREDSFLSRKSFYKGIGISEAEYEGEAGVHHRGFETIASKFKDINLLNPEEISEEARKRIMLYAMLHGYIKVPDALRDPTLRRIVSTMHMTRFTRDLLPGKDMQAAGTAAGHAQLNMLDIKYVNKGYGIQWQRFYGENGSLAKVYAQLLTPGSFAVALPGAVEHIENLEGLEFEDFSIDVFKVDSLKTKVWQATHTMMKTAIAKTAGLSYDFINFAARPHEASQKLPFITKTQKPEMRLNPELPAETIKERFALKERQIGAKVEWVNGELLTEKLSSDLGVRDIRQLYNTLTPDRLPEILRTVADTFASPDFVKEGQDIDLAYAPVSTVGRTAQTGERREQTADEFEGMIAKPIGQAYVRTLEEVVKGANLEDGKVIIGIHDPERLLCGQSKEFRGPWKDELGLSAKAFIEQLQAETNSFNDGAVRIVTGETVDKLQNAVQGAIGVMKGQLRKVIIIGSNENMRIQGAVPEDVIASMQALGQGSWVTSQKKPDAGARTVLLDVDLSNIDAQGGLASRAAVSRGMVGIALNIGFENWQIASDLYFRLTGSYIEFTALAQAIIKLVPIIHPVRWEDVKAATAAARQTLIAL